MWVGKWGTRPAAAQGPLNPPACEDVPEGGAKDRRQGEHPAGAAQVLWAQLPPQKWGEGQNLEAAGLRHQESPLW